MGDLVEEKVSAIEERQNRSEGILGANEIRFVVYGKPVPKDRPRASGHIYTPRKTQDAEASVRLAYKISCRGFKFGEGIPLRVVLDFFYAIPKSDTKKNREKKIMGWIRPTKKPDIDNVAKLVLDAVNGVAFHDDAQIVELVVRKMYSMEPRTEVYIAEVPHEE